MKIAIITIYPFPYGMASSNRVASICKGLVELGVEPYVVVSEPPNPPTLIEDLPDNGVWNGTKYYHLQGRRRNRSKLARALALKTRWRFYRGLRKTQKWLQENPVDAVIIYNDEIRYLEHYVRISKQSGAKVLFNFDEYPTPIREQGATTLPEWKRVKFKEILSNVDGYISINKSLDKFYNDIVKKPTLEMSMVVDTTRFDGRTLPRENHITYMGNILPDKDDVGNIIRAMAILKEKLPGLTFHVYGKAAPSVEAELRSLTKELNLEEVVLFKGFAPKEDIPNIMASSKIMVSSQPDNDRVRGCLSTKLAEYVAMGTPTLMCDVGENRIYLSDEDCFFVAPGNPTEYSEAVVSILHNYDNALKRSQHGRDTIRNVYSYLSAADSLINFINSLSL